MKYTKLFDNHQEYVSYTASTAFIRPNVSYCILEDEPHCTASDLCQEGHTYELIGNPTYPSSIPATATSFTLSFEYNDIFTTIACQQTITSGSDEVSVTVPENFSESAVTIDGMYDFHGIIITYSLVQEARETPAYENQYLTLEVLTDGTILWRANSGLTKTISYSKNNGETWTQITSSAEGTPIEVLSGDKVLLKGNNEQYATNKDNYSGFYSDTASTATYNVYGNIMSLIGGDNFTGLTSFNNKGFVFKSLFDGSGAVSAENLVLPVMTLTNDCYRGMFANTPSLVKAPALPATTLATNCYWFMLQRTSITKAPDLLVSSIPNGAYGGMFHEAPNVNFIKCLATNISVSGTSNWVLRVASQGTFVKSANMNDWTIGSSGIPTNWVVYDAELIEPTVACDGKRIYLTCSTYESEIYYRLNETGEYVLYTDSIPITADTVIEAYASLDGDTSNIVKETCTYIPSHDYSDDYLTLNVLTGGDILWKSIGTGQEKAISYSKDSGTTWTEITATTSGTPISVVAGDKVLLKGSNASYAKDKSNYSGFDASGDTGMATYNVEGNVMSLIYGDDFVNRTTFSGGTYNFCSLFKASKAMSAENLILPATTLTNYCYRAMFSWATNLEIAPELPATTLATNCYWYMFEATALQKAPDLLAETLVAECYGNMFTACTNLNYVKCMAKDGFSANNCKQNWLANVASSGTFVKNSEVSLETWGRGPSKIPTSWLVYDDVAVDTPSINYDGFDTIEITCDTQGATVYYKLDHEANYHIYTTAITISADTFVETYSSYDGQTSHTVSQTCVYVSDEPLEYSNRDLSKWNYNNSEVTTPYSVNGTDGHSSSYAKGTFTFETNFALKEAQPTYLWFQHADQSASIYIDDVLVEKHWGGYAAFTTDISEYVHSGSNAVKVVLKNNEGNSLAPADGDFNFNATLGNVKLLTSTVLPSASYGYDGCHITSTVSDASATINVRTTIPTGATVICTIDDGNTNIYSASSASTAEEMLFTTTIANPHLWNGTIDPHLYTVTLEIYKDGDLYHRFVRPYGLRYYEYVINDTVKVGTVSDPYTGFLLNGSKYLLRGVCMHDDIDGKANALSDADYATTFATIQELKCNFIRLAHYPHPKEVYDWCDRLGIVVQTEGPCVNKLQSTMPSDYYTHLEGQYTDMVSQHFNHPCILFWGLSNETSTDDKAFAKDKINGYVSLIKAIDSERWIGYVLNQGYGTNPSGYYNDPDCDWFGCNIYHGWYASQNDNNPSSDISTRVNNTVNRISKPVAYSEYGCGGTQRCHSDDYMTTTTRGNKPRHDIEYMMWLHEGHIAAIKEHPELLFTAQWQLFDIAVSKRNEGYTVCLDGENATTDDSLRYLNDKGLVERDHVTKKDPFYLYKAWWNPTPFVHICGKDYTKMTSRAIKCYTNDGNSLSLYVNNTFVETVSVTDNTATFTATNFSNGDIIRVDGSSTSDTFTFDV